MNALKLNKILNDKKDQLIYLVFFAVVFIICLQITLREGSDDTRNQLQMQTMSVLEWVYFRATTWQPRITGDLSLALVGFNMYLWSFLNAALVTFSMYFLEKMCALKGIYNQGQLTVFRILLECSFFFIYPYVLTNAVFWYTGSFAYLWPATAMLGALVPFCQAIQGEKTWSKKSLVVFFFCGIYASYTEQTIAVLLGFGAIVFAYLLIKRSAVPKSLICLYLLILLNSSVFALAYGIGGRGSKELHWYPDYEMLSFVDKIFQGVNVTNSHFINSSNILFLLLTSLLAFAVYQRHKGFTRFLGFVPMVYLICNVISIDDLLKNFGINGEIAATVTGENNVYKIDEVLNRVFYDSNFSNPSNLFIEFNGLLPSIFSLTIILFVCVLLWLSFANLEDRIITCTLYMAGLASSYVLGFSPTIFASGSRLFYIGNILMMFVVGKLVLQIKADEMFATKRLFKYIFCGLVGLAAILALVFMVSFTRGVLWL